MRFVITIISMSEYERIQRKIRKDELQFGCVPVPFLSSLRASGLPQQFR